MAVMTEMIRRGLGLPMHYLYYINDYESYDGLNDHSWNYLLERYGRRYLQSARAGVAWAAKNPDYDYQLLQSNFPFNNDQIYFYLRRFHETLEPLVAKHNHTFEVQFHQPVEYLTDVGQAMLRADIIDGHLIGMHGPIDTSDSYRLFHRLGTGGMYIMRADGELIITDYGHNGVRYHSALAKGEPVVCAGFIHVVDGKIISIDRRSGHYQTTSEMLQNLLSELTSRGVNTGAIAVDDTGHPSPPPTTPAITQRHESLEPNEEDWIVVGPHQVLRTILYELFYLDNLDTFEGIDDLGLHRLKSLYTYEEVEQFRMALDWAMVCHDFDFASLLPNLPYGNTDIIRYLRIFHQTLEHHAKEQMWLDIEWTGFPDF